MQNFKLHLFKNKCMEYAILNQFMAYWLFQSIALLVKMHKIRLHIQFNLILLHQVQI